MANRYLDTNIFDKAVIFAVNAHQNTERKGHKTPYVLHVIEAASICETMTNDLEILSAAVLHDVVEDTDITIEEIRKEFGDRIATLVENETEVCTNGRAPEESWWDRKQSIINRLKTATKETKMVALGDKLSNIRAIARDYEKQGEEFWKIFHNSNKNDIKWYYTSLANVLADLKEYSAYKEFCLLVDKVFNN